MARYVLVVRTNCADESRDDDFNDWYDNTHLPDVLEIPGFVAAARYVSPLAGPLAWESGKFLATYEIETEDIDKTLALMGEHMDKKRKQGRFSELLIIVGASLYKQISSMTK